ncbi:hypothetical protein [Neobacillus sp. NPDC093127]|uniref:hypothetical protein n=1 Tax=Neobacillus sp. NPDC093127 TaxID=3364296 RepID=UPI003814D643
MIGQVHVWYMTPEELAEYVKKHPIIPTGKPPVAKFSTDTIDYKSAGERKKEAFKGKKVMDGVNKDKLHKLFIKGETLDEIAAVFNVNPSTLNNFIKQQRDKDPEKWPYRAKK